MSGLDIYILVIADSLSADVGVGVTSIVVQSLKSYCARKLVATGARATTIISDLLVLVVTLYQTYKIYRPGRQEGAVPLSKFLYRDGERFPEVSFRVACMFIHRGEYRLHILWVCG